MTPVYLEIADYLMKKINTGEWPVGYMIPTEMQLCEQFGISRPTVRTAVLKLVQEGHLRRVKGKGTFVTTPHVLEQSTIFIESFFHEMRQRGFEITNEVLEFRVMHGDPEILEQMKTTGKNIIRLTRLRYVRNSFDEGPIVLTTSCFPGEFSFLFRYDFEQRSLTEVLGENEKKRRCMEKELTAIHLNARESRLLGQPEGALAMCITSLNKDKDGNFIELCRSVYPLDRNQFILKLQV